MGESFPRGALFEMLSAMDSSVPHKVHVQHPLYPLKPPGVFKCNNLGYESTAPSTAESEIGDESDFSAADATQVANLVSTTAAAVFTDAGCKKSSHDMQVVPLGNADGQPCSVRWPVDAKKLKSKDKQLVSPSVELSPGCWFRLFIKPKLGGDKSLLKGQASLSKGKGWGYVELKCVEGGSSAPALSLEISVGTGAASAPIEHDFKESTLCVLPKQAGYFDFASAVDPETLTFSLFLKAAPTRAAVQSEQPCF